MVLDVNGISLHWHTAGDGEPLLWLHGGMGCGADWQYVFDDAPPGYQIIAPDLRGHGSSTSSPAAGERFTFRQCGHDILALLHHLGLSQVKAIGVSGGGIVLFHMATLEPSSLAAMAVVSAPPYFPAQARAIMRHYSAASVGEAQVARMRQRHARGDAQVQDLFAMCRSLADSYDDVTFTPPHLATITAETLIVFGDHDPLYPVSLATELQAAIPRSFLWVLPNRGHGPVFGADGPAFVATAMDFLSGRWRA